MDKSELEKYLATKDVAASAFALLRSFDPGTQPRAELITAGISEATAASLYPPTFDALTPTLLAHLAKQDLSALPNEVIEIGANRQMVAELLDHLPESLATRWEPQWLAARGELMRPVAIEFYNLLEEDAEAAGALAMTLWHTWWLMSHLAELPQVMHGSTCYLMGWLGENLLHAPAPDRTLATGSKP